MHWKLTNFPYTCSWALTACSVQRAEQSIAIEDIHAVMFVLIMGSVWLTPHVFIATKRKVIFVRGIWHFSHTGMFRMWQSLLITERPHTSIAHMMHTYPSIVHGHAHISYMSTAYVLFTSLSCFTANTVTSIVLSVLVPRRDMQAPSGTLHNTTKLNEEQFLSLCLSIMNLPVILRM